MISETDPKVDYAFKRIFGSESNTAPLIHLLNSVTMPPPGAVVRRVRITNPLTEKDFAEQKVSILDVRAVDQANRRYNLEMQRIVPWVFGKRALYYWAALHSEQLLEGDFHQTLGPTISLCFLDGRLFEDDVVHHTFRVCDSEHGTLLCKDLEIHVVELPKLTLKPEEVKTDLQRWCYFLQHGEEMDNEHLPECLDIPEIRQAVEILIMLNQNEQERARYQSRRKTERDEASLRYAAEHALEEGREEGRKEGLVGRIHLAQRILKQPLRPTDELLTMSLADLTRLADDLEKQLFSATNGSS
jgi:predicted transposase/invertase (TIGR01784 family)